MLIQILIVDDHQLVLDRLRLMLDNREDIKILEMILNPAAKPIKSENILPSLSRHEKEILQLIIEEGTTAKIANKLFISFGKVETHRRKMQKKHSGSRGRIQSVQYA